MLQQELYIGSVHRINAIILYTYVCTLYNYIWTLTLSQDYNGRQNQYRTLKTLTWHHLVNSAGSSVAFTNIKNKKKIQINHIRLGNNIL